MNNGERMIIIYFSTLEQYANFTYGFELDARATFVPLTIHCKWDFKHRKYEVPVILTACL